MLHFQDRAGNGTRCSIISDFDESYVSSAEFDAEHEYQVQNAIFESMNSALEILS